MTNLDSVLKSKDITLPPKTHLAKAMVFPVVMYGCESYTIKKAEQIKSCGTLRLKYPEKKIEAILDLRRD